MRLWQGLGYYSRARNLHACAQEVSMIRNGRFPDNYKELLQLKGVGSYTAAAIASFAFGEKVAVVDGNVFRVLARYFGVATDIGSSQGKRAFGMLANQIIPESVPDEYNQAIMEFGALQCVPKNPSCGECPLNTGCFAFKHGLVKELPVNEKKIRITQRAFLYFHINCGDEILVKERGANDIWQGLVDFPVEELASLENINLNVSPLLSELQAFEPHIQFDPEKNYKHILTHQKIFSNFVKLNIAPGHQNRMAIWAEEKGYFPVNEHQLERLGKPKIGR